MYMSTVNITHYCCYRPASIVIVTWLLETLEEDDMLDVCVLITKAGRLGLGRHVFSPTNITMTSDILGRSIESSCTHKSATLIHFITSLMLHESSNDFSVSCIAFSSIHSLHACDNFQLDIKTI